MRHAAAASVVTCLFSLCPHIVAAARVAPCAGGRFLPDVALVSGDAAPVTDAIIIDAGSQLSIGSSCGPARARLRGSSQGTLVKSTLRCNGVRGKVKLKARFDADCGRLSGTLKVGRQKKAFSARRSTGCGDGLVDPGLGEQCEAPGDCPAGQTCAGCGCVPALTTSTIPSTTTTTTSATATSTTTLVSGNRAPTAVLTIAPSILQFGAPTPSATLDFSQSSDPDAGDGVASYVVTLVTAPAGSTGGSAGGQIFVIGTPVETALSSLGFVPDVAGTYRFGLLVRDTHGAASPQVMADLVAVANTMLTPEERSASMDAVDARLAELPGIDVVADNEQLASFMSSRPEFVDAGTSDHGLTAWGEWRDGVQYLIVRNREPGTGTPAASASQAMTAPAPSAASRSVTPGMAPSLQLAADATSPESGHPSNMPASNQLRLLSSMGPGWADVRSTLHQYLVGRQLYNEITAAATVDGLKAVRGDGIFYMSAHGGNGKGKHPYAVYTATEWSVADDVRYVTDLAAGRLVIMRACYDSLNGCDEKAHPEAYERHYAFTAQFVHDYWGDFADRSLIFLDFCSSNSTISTSLTTELLAKHAGLVLGWDDVTNDADAGATALFIFDRLVGANDFRTEMGFKQRAFDWISALSDCSNHSVCTSNSAHLVATEPAPGCRNNPGACDDAFGLLAPSIRQMYVFESYAREIAPDLLFIVGLFGRDQGSGRFHPLRGVSIGGNDVPIFDWGPNLIAVELPHTGAGSSGEVVVRVRNHTSNVAQLTEWEVPFTLVLDDFQSLRQTVTVKARFRVDIRKSVRTIHQAPDDPQPSGLEFQALRDDSTATYVCAGTASIVTNEGTETETWSGSGAIADFKNLTKFSPVAVVTSTLIGLNLSGWNQDCDSVLMVSGYPPAPGNPVVIDPQEISPAPDGSTAGSVDLQLDTVGNVFGDAKTKTVQSHSALNADGNAAAVWRWPMTSPVPGTAPDPNSAR